MLACFLSLNAIYFCMKLQQKSTLPVLYCAFQMFTAGLLTIHRNWQIISWQNTLPSPFLTQSASDTYEDPVRGSLPRIRRSILRYLLIFLFRCGFQRREEREERSESESCWGQNNLGIFETLHFPYGAVLASTR